MDFLRKHLRTIALLLIDTCASILSCAVTFFLIKYLDESERGINIVLRTNEALLNSIIITALLVIGMAICRVYRSIWRFAEVGDYLKCLYGSAMGTIAYIVFKTLFFRHFSDVFIAFSVCFSFFAFVMLRAGYSVIYKKITRRANADRTRTLVIGAGDAARKLIFEMQGENSIYEPIALVDDDPSKYKRVIQGVTVLGTTNDIPEIVEKNNIKTIFFAIPSCDNESKKRIIHICSETICEVKIIPRIYDLMTNSDYLRQAKEINTEDLLGREPVRFNDNKVNELIHDKICMVTGGGGSIGSELCRQIAKYFPKKLIIVDIYENNAYSIQQELLSNYPDLDLDVRIASVRDFDKMEKLFQMFKPEIVYHAAAHKHVPLMETSPEEAIKNNIGGTYNVAFLANKYKVRKFVLVSTDKAVNPTNVMGATKRCCEMIDQYFAQKSDYTEFVAVRFGNVLGSNGSVIPLFEKQLAAGGPLTVTHPEIIRYFMTIPEAVSLILQAGTIAKGGEIFVLDMGEPVKILTLAENLIKLHGKEPYVDVDIKFTGLRPGEKLFEELLMAEEGIKETANKKIFIGTQIEIDESTFENTIENIKSIAYTNSSEEAVEALKKVVPTFNHVVINK